MYLKNWMKRWLWVILICVLVLFICFLTLFFTNLNRHEKPQNEYVINQIRLTVNELLLYIEDHFTSLEQNSNLHSSLQEMSKSEGIDITVVQLDGKVIFNSIEGDPSQFINLEKDLHYDLFTSQQQPGIIKIAFPIISETNEQLGNAIFTIDKDVLLPVEQSSHSNFIILFISVLLCFLIIGLAFYIVRKSNKEILLPLNHLKKNTEEIVKGNYEQNTVYSRADEIGELYAVFDQMRVEIKNLTIQRDEQEQNQKKLISSISHEVRTPLTTIKAYLDAISDGICPDTDSLMSYIQIMQTNTEKMSRLIDDLFIHTLKELGHIPVNLTEQYSKDVFTNILHPIHHYVQTTGIHFIGPEYIPNVLIQVDEHRLEQVLSNLITNALKHTIKGDSITVSINIENQLLNINVIDTGNGMLPEDMPFIFERYFRGIQATGETAVKNEGAGLGLSICKHIMEAHNGSISFKSTQNVGTTFTLTLPII
ncbi:HAMP domain-containing histidine kinase [Lysinibacillus xylanilyticus]|uniref:sensor histidine kinase n=1 Tax=Lysinibacillus xylanilyticus TaxID=582475 RepID=UPI002B25276D|nr:HAMP domain-containing sensor histidine kinase [Lysinibacillus xylanilyticus]MEB2301706.1 HAMP domain-containing histidine kinase [Lysinibacillus xylanilyticus]